MRQRQLVTLAMMLVLIVSLPGPAMAKKADGGDSWRELKQGLPKVDKGRIGLGAPWTPGRLPSWTMEYNGDGR